MRSEVREVKSEIRSERGRTVTWRSESTLKCERKNECETKNECERRTNVRGSIRKKQTEREGRRMIEEGEE